MGNCDSQSILEYAHVPVLGKLGPVQELRIINSIWLRDYQGLFDYDSKQVKRSIISIKQNCTLFAEGDKKVTKQITNTQRPQKIMKSAMFEVIKRSNYFKVLPICIQNQQETIQKLLWVVVRTVPSQKYHIKEKDVLKFGKLRTRVREIVLYDSNSTGVTDFNLIKTSKKIYEDLKMRQGAVPSPNTKDLPNSDLVSIATQNEPICRICLQPGQNHNPLICPCKCTGSVKFIHILCLRTWLGKQLNITKGKHCISVKWTPLTCQMCKTHYKYRIYMDNKKYYTVEIPKPAKPYIVLQVLKKSAEFSKIYHFISMADTSKLSIGRKKDIDIKLSQDISVSRHHANLLYDFEGKRFLLEDNKSKFGTLVLVKKNVLANPFQRGLSFQMGGELFTFECIRGQGSIPDYHDEENFLNVVEKGEKKTQEQSEDNNQDEDDYDGVDDQPPSNIPHNLTSALLGNNSGNNPLENNNNSLNNNSNVILNHSGVSNNTNVNANLPSMQQLQPLAQPQPVQVALVPEHHQPAPPEPAQVVEVQNLDD